VSRIMLLRLTRGRGSTTDCDTLSESPFVVGRKGPLVARSRTGRSAIDVSGTICVLMVIYIGWEVVYHAVQA
jgi:hypothetical protein